MRTTTLQEVPSLDELAADLKLVKNLPPEVALDRYLVCMSVLMTLGPQLAIRKTEPSSTNCFLNVDDVAQLIGMSGSWVEKHVKDLPPRKSIVGNPRWEKRDIEHWMKNRPIYGKSA